MKTYYKIGALGLFIISFAAACTFENKDDQVANSLKEIALQAGTPAIQVAHTKAGTTHLYEFGLHKADSTAQIDEKTIFQAASLTKVVAAYTFFKLADQGVINLDTPLMHYYAYDRLMNVENADKITARMVLTHRSGLPNWQGNVLSPSWRKENPLSLLFLPGADYGYSGEGFYFLQETLEHLTGRTFRDLVEEECLQPLGMHNSTIIWLDSLEKNAAYGHTAPDQPRKLGKYPNANAAYTLYTTAEDYTFFIKKALFDGVGLKAETHANMVSKSSEAKKAKETNPEDQFVPCALGFRLQLNELGTAYWHTGSNPGFRCFFLAYPEQQEILVAFTNSDAGFKAMKPLMKAFLPHDQTFWAYDWREGELD